MKGITSGDDSPWPPECVRKNDAGLCVAVTGAARAAQALGTFLRCPPRLAAEAVPTFCTCDRRGQPGRTIEPVLGGPLTFTHSKRWTGAAVANMTTATAGPKPCPWPLPRRCGTLPGAGHNGGRCEMTTMTPIAHLKRPLSRVHTRYSTENRVLILNMILIS